MSSGQQIPPWLQEQIMKMQQDQQNLQSIMAQKQQVDMEKLEAEKALEELKKASDDENVYKHAGSILIKAKKGDLISELEEKQELANTRISVLEKQKARLEATLKEHEKKLNEMMKGSTSSSGAKQSDSNSQRQPNN